MDDSIKSWSEDPEFKALPRERKQRILTNYFDSELADDEFRGLDSERQTKIKDNFLSSIIKEEKETPLLPAIGRAAATIPLHIGRAAAGVVQRGAEYAEAERAEIRGALKTVRGAEPLKPEKERKPLVTDEGFGALLLDLMGKGVEKLGVGVEAVKETAPVKAYGKFRAKGRLAEAVLNKEVKPEVERLVRKGDRESLTKASALLESGEGFISKTVAEKYLAEPIAGVAAAIGEELGEAAEAIRPVTRRGSYKYYVTSAIEGVGATMVPAVAATLITKKPGVGLAIMFPQVFGESYSEERARGKDVVESTQKGLFSAATEVLSEAIPLGILTRVGGKLTKRIFKGAAAEGIQEAVNEAAQIAYDEGIINEYTPAREIGRRLLDAGIIGAIGGGGMAVVAHSFTGKEEEATEGLKKDVLDSITETYDKGDQTADQTINSIKEGYKGGLFTDAALDELSKKYPELKDGIETIKEVAKGEAVRDTLTEAIDVGFATGELRGQAFEGSDALDLIRNGLVNDIFTTEDVDGFKTKYPQLRSGLNELLAIQTGATVEERLAPSPVIEPPTITRLPEKEYADKDLEAIYVKAKERARTEPLTLHELQERFGERKKREITEKEKEEVKRIFEKAKKFIRKEKKVAALPPGEQFELVEPKPEVKIRPRERIYPRGAEYVAGKPAPEELPVEYKPILKKTAKGDVPWKTMSGAENALKSEKLRDKGISFATHKITEAPSGGYQIVKLGERSVLAERKVKEKVKGKTLLSWVKAMGGVRDVTLPGEVRALTAKEAGVVGLTTKEMGKGLGFDEMASAAVAEGWLPENLEDESGAFMELLEKDIRGIKEGRPEVRTQRSADERVELEREERRAEFERAEIEELEHYAAHPDEEVRADLDQWQRKSVEEIRRSVDEATAREIEESVKGEVEGEDADMEGLKGDEGFTEFVEGWDEKDLLDEEGLAELEAWRAEKEIIKPEVIPEEKPSVIEVSKKVEPKIAPEVDVRITKYLKLAEKYKTDFKKLASFEEILMGVAASQSLGRPFGEKMSEDQRRIADQAVEAAGKIAKMRREIEVVPEKKPELLKSTDSIGDITLGEFVTVASRDPAQAAKHIARATVSRDLLREGLRNKGLALMGEVPKSERPAIEKNLETVLKELETAEIKYAMAEPTKGPVYVRRGTLTDEVLGRMNKYLKSLGYDTRGKQDVYQSLKGRTLEDGTKLKGLMNNKTREISQPDWADAYERAMKGIEVRKEKLKIKKEAKISATNVNWDRIRELGKTHDIKEAGYITSEGEYIDLSGKREGGQPGTRSYDHREAGGTAGMQEFIALGNIRMDANAGTMDILAEPTSAQHKKIAEMVALHRGKVVIDLGEGLGEYRDEYYLDPERTFSYEYSKGTSLSEIRNDIENFYAGKDVKKSNIRFSIIEPARGITVTETRSELVERLGERATTALLTRGVVRLVTPEEAVEITGSPEAAKANGFFSNGVSHLVPANIRKGRTWNILMHELGTHWGYEAIFGKKRARDIFDAFVARKGGASPLGEAIRFAYKKVPEKTNPAHVNEEALAYFITDAANRRLSLGRKIIAAVRMWAVKTLGVRPSVFTEDDYVAIAVSAVRRAAREAEEAPVREGTREGVSEEVFYAKDIRYSIKEQKDLKSWADDLIKSARDKGVVMDSEEPSPERLRETSMSILAGLDIKKMSQPARSFAEGMSPKGKGYGQFIEKWIASPEWYQHPVLKEIIGHSLDKSGRFHNLFNEFNAVDDPFADAEHDTVAKTLEALARKGKISKAAFILGRTSADFKRLETLLDDADMNGKKWTVEELTKAGYSPDVIGAWSAVRDSYDKQLGARLKPMKDLIARIEEQAAFKGIDPKDVEYPDFGEYIIEGKKRRLNLKEATMFMGQLKGFYSPRIRDRGDWVITARKDVAPGRDEFVRYNRRTKSFANLLRDDLAKKGFVDIGIEKTSRLPEETFQAIRMAEMGTVIGEAARKGLDKYDAEMQMAFMDDMMLAASDMIKSRGSRSMMIRRQRGPVTRGYITNPLVRFIRYTSNNAAGIAKAEMAEKMIKALYGEYKEGKKTGGLDAAKDAGIHSLARAYVEEQLRNAETGDRLVGIAKGLTTLKFLGFNPRSVLVNISSLTTSVPMSLHTYVMEGRGSLARIGVVLSRSCKDYTKVMTGKRLASVDEMVFIDAFRDSGYTDAQYTRDAIGNVQGAYGTAWSRLMSGSMYVFGRSEEWVRGGTALAAYRLGRRSGLSHTEASDKAVEATANAHGTYGKETLPMVAWGKGVGRLGQAFYTYLKFPHNYLQMLYDAGVRKKNVKGVVFGLAAPAVLGGVAATPMFETVIAVCNVLLSLIDDDRDAEKLVYDTLNEHLGEEVEKTIRGGLLGVLDVDISGSLSMGPGAIPTSLFELTGAVGGMTEDIGRGLGYAVTGEYARAAEAVLPKAAANILTAIRELRGATTRRGDRIWDEQGNPYMPEISETIKKGFGFRSTRRALLAQTTWVSKREERRFKETQSGIYKKVKFLATRPEDAELKKDVADRISEYNTSALKTANVPLITPASIERQMRRMAVPTAKKRARAMRGERAATFEGDIWAGALGVVERERMDRTQSEVKRLSDAGLLPYSREPSRTLDVGRGIEVVLDDDQYSRYILDTSRAIKNGVDEAVARPEWRDWTDKKRVYVIRRIINRRRKRIRDRLKRAIRRLRSRR